MFLSIVMVSQVFLSSLSVVSASEVEKLPSDDVIIVEIAYGNPTKDEIESIVLEDGSSVSDHDYNVVSSPMSLSRSARSYDALGTYLHYAAWINRDGKVSLSLKLKDDIKWGSRSGADRAWSAISNTRIGFGSDYRFRNNPVGLHDQYICHYYFAKLKTEWNLEPYAPNVGYWGTVAKGCNPS